MSKTKFCFFICLVQFFLISYVHVEIIKNEKILICEDSPWLKSGLLNSTRIELKFGSYGVKVLAQDPVKGIRLSSLYSVHGNEQITRTLAFTRYESKVNDKLKMAHEEILAGGSIGTILNKHGFDLKKELFFKGFVEDMPEEAQNLMQTQESLYAAIIYNLMAIQDNESYPYCTILEVYSPEFLSLADVQLIYPVFNNTKLSEEETSNAIDMINQMEKLLQHSLLE